MRPVVLTAVLLLAVAAAVAGCGGSAAEPAATPEQVCTQMTNIAGTLKNLNTGISSGQASIDAITYTTKQLKQELIDLDAAMADINDPNAAKLSASFRQFQLAYSRLPPGTTPQEAQTQLKEPADAVKASYRALVDSLACPLPASATTP